MKSEDEIADAMEEAVLAANPKIHVGMDWGKAEKMYEALKEASEAAGVPLRQIMNDRF